MSEDDFVKKLSDLLADRTAAAREHSHASTETFRRLQWIVANVDSNASDEEVATSVVLDIGRSGLVEIVRDWLSGRGLKGSP